MDGRKGQMSLQCPLSFKKAIHGLVLSQNFKEDFILLNPTCYQLHSSAHQLCSIIQDKQWCQCGKARRGKVEHISFQNLQVLFYSSLLATEGVNWGQENYCSIRALYSVQKKTTFPSLTWDAASTLPNIQG